MLFIVLLLAGLRFPFYFWLPTRWGRICPLRMMIHLCSGGTCMHSDLAHWGRTCMFFTVIPLAVGTCTLLTVILPRRDMTFMLLQSLRSLGQNLHVIY